MARTREREEVERTIAPAHSLRVVDPVELAAVWEADSAGAAHPVASSKAGSDRRATAEAVDLASRAVMRSVLMATPPVALVEAA